MSGAGKLGLAGGRTTTGTPANSSDSVLDMIHFLPIRLIFKDLAVFFGDSLDFLQKSGTGNREQGTEIDKTEHLQEVF
jgi:hypothetical protein